MRLEIAEDVRDRSHSNTAIDRKLHGCALARLLVADVCAAGHLKERSSILQIKTRKPVRYELTTTTRRSIKHWPGHPRMIGQAHLWPGRFHEPLHISTRQYARLIRDWVTSIGLEQSACGTHAMRRMKVAKIHLQKCNLRAVQRLLGQAKMDSTVSYFGVELEDALAFSEAVAT